MPAWSPCLSLPICKRLGRRQEPGSGSNILRFWDLLIGPVLRPCPPPPLGASASHPTPGSRECKVCQPPPPGSLSGSSSSRNCGRGAGGAEGGLGWGGAVDEFELPSLIHHCRWSIALAVFKYCLNCNSGGKVFFVTDQKIYIKLIPGGGSCLPPPRLAGESWKLRHGGNYLRVQDTAGRAGGSGRDRKEQERQTSPSPRVRPALPASGRFLTLQSPSQGAGAAAVSEREGAQPTGSTQPPGRARCAASLRPAQGPLNSVKTSLGAAGGPRTLQIPPGRPTRGLDHMGLTEAPSLTGGVGSEGLSLTFLI